MKKFLHNLVNTIMLLACNAVPASAQVAADSLCTEDSIGRCAWNADAEAKRREAKMNIYDLPY